MNGGILLSPQHAFGGHRRHEPCQRKPFDDVLRTFSPACSPAIVARECKGLKIQGARNADRRRHTRRYVRRAERVHPGDSAPYAAAADCGEKSGLVCASRSCPDLRREAYTAAQIDAQLNDQSQRFLKNPVKGLRIDRKTAHASRIFDWFEDDFEAYGGSNTSCEPIARICPRISNWKRTFPMTGA